MPRPKKLAATLTLHEFDTLESAIVNLLARVRGALTDSEQSRQLVAKLESVGFFKPMGATAKAAAAPKANHAANGAVKKRRTRRHHTPIESAAIVAAVKKGGSAGLSSGQIAAALKVDFEQLRRQLYVLRDAGAIKMVGKLAAAKYVAGAGKSESAPAKKVKAAKPAAPTSGKKVKAAKPAKETAAAVSSPSS